MTGYLFGHEHDSRRPFRIPRSSFDTHWHLIGGTSKENPFPYSRRPR